MTGHVAEYRAIGDVCQEHDCLTCGTHGKHKKEKVSTCQKFLSWLPFSVKGHFLLSEFPRKRKERGEKKKLGETQSLLGGAEFEGLGQRMIPVG